MYTLKAKNIERPHFITERELAEQLRCSVPAVRAWRKKGLPARRFGRLVRYELDRVLVWFDEHEFGGQDDDPDAA